MKGFTKDGKFHPIKPYNKVRKARDQSLKTQGIKYDGLGRRLPVKLGKIGDIVKVSKGSGIDSGKVGKIIGRKPAQDFPQSATDWYQVRIIKPENMKGVIIQSPRDRLEKIEGTRKARDRKEVKNIKYDIQFFEDDITNHEGEDTRGFQGSITKGDKMITAEVYPVNPNDPSEGWEYRLDGDVGTLGRDYDGRYESYFESWTGNTNDHAGSSDKAMEWAENTAIDFLEGN